jgi:hypothetical protein
MSLEFLSGIGAPKRKQARQVKRQAKKAARVEKKTVKVERKALKKGKVNARQMRALQKKAPATAARIKKMVVDQTRRAKMEEQAEPLVSAETPNIDEQAENEVMEEAQENFNEGVEEVDAPEFEGSGNPDSEEGGADMGVIYPNYYALSGRKNKAQRQAKKTQRKAKKAARKVKRKAKIKKFAKGAVKIGMAPARKAFLAVVKLGKKTEKLIKFNLAKRLATLYKFDNGASLSKFWAKFGGKPEELKNAIIKGGATINGDSLGAEPTTTALVLSTATPIIVALVALIADINKKKQAQGEPILEEETQAPEMEVNTEVETEEEISGLNKFRLQKLKAMRLKQFNQE